MSSRFIINKFKLIIQGKYDFTKNSSQLTSQVKVNVKSTGGQSSQNPIMK